MRPSTAYVALLFGLLGVSYVSCDSKRLITSLCSVALRIDCAEDYVQQTDETLCATNHQTYTNLCFFSKEKCNQPELNIQYFGACQTTTATTTTTSTSSPATSTHTQQPLETSSTTTTARIETSSTTTTARIETLSTTTTARTPTTTVDEYEILRRVFCAPESQVNCALFDSKPYCGSDLKVYNNECEFVKAQCTLDIKAQDMTYCISHGHSHRH